MNDIQDDLLTALPEPGGPRRSSADLAHALAPVFARVSGMDNRLAAHTAQLDAKMAEVVAKVNKVAKQAGLVGKLGVEMRELADKLEEVAAAQAEAEAAAKVPPWDWSAMSPDQMRNAFKTIADWLDSTGRMFGLIEVPPEVATHLQDAANRPGGLIRGCWYQHWDVVMELGWLVQAYQQAYAGPTASIKAVADFHDRYLNSTIDRISRASTMRECKGGAHRDPFDPRRGLATGHVDRKGLDDHLNGMFAPR